MIEAIGIVSGIFTEWFLEELHLQQVGKALPDPLIATRTLHSQRGLWACLALPHFFVNMDKAKQTVSLKNQLSQHFLPHQHGCGRQNNCSDN